MKILIITILLIISNIGLGFNGKVVFKAKNRTKVCSPLNSLTSGLMVSNNFGKTYGACSGFTCQSGYTVSGGGCVASLVANVSCYYDNAQYSSTPYCTSYSNGLSFSSVSIYTYFCIFGCTSVTGTYSYKRNFNCPSIVSGLSNWTYNQVLPMFDATIVAPTNAVMYKYLGGLVTSTSPVMLEHGVNKLYAINPDLSSSYLSGTCTAL